MSDISEAPEPDEPTEASLPGSPTAAPVVPARIAIGADHAGYDLKLVLVQELGKLGFEIQDLGTDSLESCDYPDYGHAVSEAVEEGRADRGVRAVVCSEPFSARMSRRHNDANVLCLGARVVGAGTALDIVDAFLRTPYEGGRHARRVSKIDLGTT
jgi:ribose 5-phosphate isomerase B